MNKRCIVNVATGEFYCKMQGRLLSSFEKCVDNYEILMTNNGIIPFTCNIDKGIDLMLWKDCLPEGSRPHEESPYGFKVHAIKAAYEMGYTSILWIDSPAYAVKEDIRPIFDKIEKEGYYAMSHIDPLENWVGDDMLSSIGVGLSRDGLKGLNLPSGSCYGFDLSSETGKGIFASLTEFEKHNLFKNQVIAEGKWHRHDEAALAMSLIWAGRKVFTFDPLFQSIGPECVIKSGG